MKIRQFEIWLADLNPRMGTEPGKKRPVLIVQSDLLNKTNHPSTLVCPLTTNIKLNSKILRVNIKKEIGEIERDSDIMIDQIRAIDNKRLTMRLGKLPENLRSKVKNNIDIIFDLSL